MSRSYYSLLYRPNEFARWGIEFGDYDKSVVEDEMRDQKEHATERGGRWKIIKTTPGQRAIDAKVAELNAKETGTTQTV